MSTKEEDSVDQQQFKQIQSRIVDVFTDMGSQRGRNRRASVISAHLYLRKEITQAELKALTNFSAVTISTVLNSYMKQGFVKKDFREDPATKKPKYYYSTPGTFKEDLGKSIKHSQQFIPHIIQKLSEVKEKIKSPDLKGKTGYIQLETFVENMGIYITAYMNLLQKLRTKTGGDKSA